MGALLSVGRLNSWREGIFVCIHIIGFALLQLHLKLSLIFLFLTRNLKNFHLRHAFGILLFFSKYIWSPFLSRKLIPSAETVIKFVGKISKTQYLQISFAQRLLQGRNIYCQVICDVGWLTIEYLASNIITMDMFQLLIEVCNCQ